MRVGKSGPKCFSLLSAINLIMLVPRMLLSAFPRLLLQAFKSPRRYTGVWSLRSLSRPGYVRKGGKYPVARMIGPLDVWISTARNS